jgi:hypothetical protein
VSRGPAIRKLQRTEGRSYPQDAVDNRGTKVARICPRRQTLDVSRGSRKEMCFVVVELSLHVRKSRVPTRLGNASLYHVVLCQELH